jgi:hypothetical protein
MGLLFILGIVLGITVDPGWFWMSGIVALIVVCAELVSDW